MAVAIRSCRVCRTSRSKGELQRWVRHNGQLVADPTATLPGRGFYTCRPACATKLPAVIGSNRR